MCFSPNLMNQGKFIGGLKFNTEQKGEAWVKKKLADGELTLIPCGQCMQCKITYAAQWAARCELEAKNHENSWFVTVTYSDEYLPIHNTIEDTEYHGIVNPIAYVEGVTIERPTLIKADHQKFLKRLRKQALQEGLLENNFKYYMCGEYGDKYGRPHYHYILFGIKLPDIKFNYAKNGYNHYRSEWLEKRWGMGIVDIGECSYLTCQYVARYIIKKQKGKEGQQFYKETGITPEFVQMSLKPGIGEEYFWPNREKIYEHDKIQLQNGRTVKPPRFYDLKMDMEKMAEEAENYQWIADTLEPEDAELQLPIMQSQFMRNIKEQRRMRAQDRLNAEMTKTSIGMTEYYDIKAKEFENKHKRAKERKCEPQK